MDVNPILQGIAKMFPSVNLGQAVSKAQEVTNGVPDTLDGVSKAAANLGIDHAFVQKFYNKYGNTAQARMICSMMGTTPEALKADAEKIVGADGVVPPQMTYPASAKTVESVTKKFPRLK